MDIFWSFKYNHNTLMFVVPTLGYNCKSFRVMRSFQGQVLSIVSFIQRKDYANISWIPDCKVYVIVNVF